MKPSAARRGRGDRQAGFALIEAIAVMLLSGLVMLTLLIATDLVTRNARAATQRANAVEGLATGLAALRRDIAAASFTRGGEGPDGTVLFEGGPRALSLVLSGGAPAGEGSPASPAPGLVRVEARYEDGRGLLVRSEAAAGMMTDGFSGASFGNPVVLLSGPWTYRLSYGATTAGKMAWQESWANAKLLPDVVRLEILQGATGEPVVAPLLVALRVDAEIRCLESESGGCRGGEEEGAAEAAEPEGQDDDFENGEGGDGANQGG